MTRMEEKRKGKNTQIANARNGMRYSTTNLTEIKMIKGNYDEQLWPINLTNQIKQTLF